MSNLFKRFVRLLPSDPTRVGTITSVDTTSVVIQEDGGRSIRVLGTGTVGSRVYFRNAGVVGDAPNLTLYVVEE